MQIQLLQLSDCYSGKSARSISMMKLNQSLIYEGQMESPPTKEKNKRHLERIPEKVYRAYSYIPIEPYIITPTETPMEYRGGKTYPFGEPASIPQVQCISRWTSFEYRNADFDYSTLVVVWFQDQVALPIDAEVVQSHRKIGLEFAGAQISMVKSRVATSLANPES